MAQINSRYARFKPADSDARDPVAKSGDNAAQFATALGGQTATQSPLAAAVAGPLSAAPGPNAISLTTAGTAYTQDFNSLANSGTANTATPPGFSVVETGTGANTTYRAGTGSENTGDTYSFGAAGSTERAFGTLLSGSVTPAIQAEFANNTGSAITSLAISYTGELYRIGGTGRADRLDFQYSLDGTTWIDADVLDFVGPNSPTGTATGLRDGNAAANQTAISGTITGLNIPVGQAFFVRVLDFNAAGSDDGLAIDNFSLTANPPPPASPGAFSIDSPTVTEGNGGATPITFTITRPTNSSGAASVDYTVNAPGGSGFAGTDDFVSPVLTGTIAFAANETSRTIALNVAGDTVVEPTETFTVTLSNATGGATIQQGAGTGTGTITNDDVAGAGSTVSIADARVTEGNAGTTALTFTLTRTETTGAASVDYSTTFGTASADDFAAGQPFTGTATFAEGAATATITLQVTGDTVVEPDETLTITLANAVGTTIGDGSAAGIIANDDVAASPGGLSISDATVTEGNAGTTPAVFTVTRPTGSNGVVSVDYTVTFGTGANQAGADDFAANTPFAGTLTFADGELSRTVSLPVVGDAVVEGDETFTVTLSNPTGGATLSDATGVGTIRNDDAALTAIYTIQGEGHRSALAGTSVTTSGVVTAIAGNGFYLQDPTGDGNVRTSDGIFVFTSSAPTVTVGQAVRVAGGVVEFQPGGASTNNLTTTQINPTSVTVTGTGSVAATLIGTGGRTPPTMSYGDDNNATFDPATEGLDFFETLEGMLVTVQSPRVLNQGNSFDEVQVVASGGAQATGINARGGITILPGDFNPERIQLDDSLLPAFEPDTYTQGDILNDVTGVVSYNFQSYEVLVTQIPTVATDVPPLPLESTTLRGTADHLSVASYNVRNLSAVDSQTQFTQLGEDIAQRLGAPDIIGLSEIQDADGAGMGSDTSGQATADRLIQAIVDAGGPRYEYVEVAPVANTSGGEPGGNIRNGFLFNPLRVDFVEGSAVALMNAAYDNTRKPLIADFNFNGETVTVAAVHFTSRGGSDGLGGANQPPTNAGDDRREAQAAALRTELDSRQAANPEGNFVVVGDFNSFYFERSLGNLQDGPTGLSNLYGLIAPEERYTFLFDGNLQPLDNVLVSPNLLFGAALDAVHINAEQPSTVSRPSDHDPLVATVRVTANDTLSGTAGNDVRRSDAGNDFFFLQQGGNDTTSGGAGDDAFYFGAAMTVDDVVDGGAGGNDQLGIQGDYTGARALTLGNVTNIEVFGFLSGDDARFGDPGNPATLYSYDVTTDNRNVAAGATLTVDGARLRVGENIIFNGAAETDGSFFIYAGMGTDRLTGGQQNDVFLFREVRGFTAADRIDGGGGSLDQLGLRGNYTGANAVVFEAATMINVEGLALISGRDTRFGRENGQNYSYDITLDDGNVADGALFIVDAGTLTGVETARFDGSRESTGRFEIFGGDGGDTLIGGQGADMIRGGLGADVLTGSGGADIFRYQTAAESTAAARDTITDFATGVDRIDLSRIDANTRVDGNDAFTYIDDRAFSGAAGELRTVTDATGTRIEGDTDGNGIADFVIVLTDVVAPLPASDFIL